MTFCLYFLSPQDYREETLNDSPLATSYDDSIGQLLLLQSVISTRLFVVSTLSFEVTDLRIDL